MRAPSRTKRPVRHASASPKKVDQAQVLAWMGLGFVALSLGVGLTYWVHAYVFQGLHELTLLLLFLLLLSIAGLGLFGLALWNRLEQLAGPAKE